MCIDSFRIASSSDANAVTCLVNESYRPEAGKAGWTHESDLVAGNRTSIAQVLEYLAKPDSAIQIGLRNSCKIAFVHIENDSANSYIGMLTVSPAFHALGAGEQMLSYAERHAETVFSSNKCVILVVSSRTDLITFYMRRVYRKTSTAMDYPI
jgi:ribosomal protein S18 acetylase RimI-like enzyme